MRKRVQIVLAFLLVAVGGIIAWQVLHSQEREPAYQGKGLRVWLAEYDSAFAMRNGPAQDIAEGAIRQIGTNAIPTLLNMLRKKDSNLVSKLAPQWGRHITRIPHLPAWLRVPRWYRHRAVDVNVEALRGFEVLGADAGQAVPALITIYELNISPDSQFCVIQALHAIGPEASRTAIPSLLRGAVSSDTHVRENAVWALSKVHAEPTLVVPALIKSLGDTNVLIRGMAAVGLQDIKWQARPAVPALVLSLRDPDGQVRRNAGAALINIDPEAAARAGVK